MYHGGREMAFLHDRLYMALPPQNGQLYYEFIGYLDLATVQPDTCVQIVGTGIAGERTMAREGLHLYPNPAETLVNVQLPVAGQWRLVLHDAQGRSIREVQYRYVSGGPVELSLGGLAPGPYLVTALGEGRRLRRYIVKR